MLFNVPSSVHMAQSSVVSSVCLAFDLRSHSFIVPAMRRLVIKLLWVMFSDLVSVLCLLCVS